MDRPSEDESVTQSSQSSEMPSLGEPTPTQSPSTMTGKPCPCLMTKSPATKSRNLVICIDGTSNQFGSLNTNVIELYSHILKQEDDEQLTYYDSGIGTYATPSWKSWGYVKQVIYNKIDLAIAWNIEKVIIGAYRWLSNHYRCGDKVFLFGFSRGAFQVRALAGMIDLVGLILPGNEAQIPFAFQLYAQDDPNSDRAEVFKRTFSRENVRVHFIGVWDTVSSVGFLRPKKMLPRVVGCCDHICVFRHALALDERRVKFLPEFIHEGASHTDDENIKFPSMKHRKCTADIKEVWFAGSHSDVGGGNRVNARLQSGDIPLLWMRNEAIAAGLRLKAADNYWKSQDLDRAPYNSLAFMWHLLEQFPMRRLSYKGNENTSHWPHRGKSRKIVAGQKVHASVILRPSYRPAPAFPQALGIWPAQLDWDDPACHHQLNKLDPIWEKDLFENSTAETLLNQLVDGVSDQLIERVAFMASSDEGRKAISRIKNALDILEPFLSEKKDKEIRITASAAFAAVVDRSEVGRLAAIEDTGCLSLVISSLKQGEESDSTQNLYISASGAVGSYAHHDTLRSRLVGDGVLEALVHLCRSTQHEICDSAARALLHLMKYNEVAHFTADTGIASSIISLINKEDTTIPMSGARILEELSKHKCARDIMIDKKAVSNFINLLDSKSKGWYVKSSRINAMCNLAQHDELRQPILESSAITFLVERMEHKDKHKRNAYLTALITLAHHDDLRGRILEMRLINVLLKQLSRDETRKKAQHAFVRLAAHEDARGLMIKESLIHDLVKQLGTDETFDGAQSTLFDLSKYDKFRDEIINKSNFFKKLKKRIVHGGVKVDNVVEALAKFCTIGAYREAIIRSDLIKGILDCIRGSPLWGMEVARGVLGSSLLADDQIRITLLNGGLVKTISDMISKGCQFALLSIPPILAAIGGYDDIRKAVLTSDILSNFANRTRKTFYFPRDFPDDYFHIDIHNTLKEVRFYDIKETTLQDDIVFLTSMLTTTTRHPLGLVKTSKYGSTNVPRRLYLVDQGHGHGHRFL